MLHLHEQTVGQRQLDCRGVWKALRSGRNVLASRVMVKVEEG
jgi:hypothetical protein